MSEHLPEIHPIKLSTKKEINKSDVAGFQIKINTSIHTPYPTLRSIQGFHDGPDVRLVPVTEINKAMRSVMNRKSSLVNFSYVDGEGKFQLRKVLSDYLNDTRGLQTTFENIFITRGSQMGIYMLTATLLSDSDILITLESNFSVQQHIRFEVMVQCFYSKYLHKPPSLCGQHLPMEV